MGSGVWIILGLLILVFVVQPIVLMWVDSRRARYWRNAKRAGFVKGEHPPRRKYFW